MLMPEATSNATSRSRLVSGPEPIASDIEAWFAELDRFADVPLFEDGRNQPPTPGDEAIFG